MILLENMKILLYIKILTAIIFIISLVPKILLKLLIIIYNILILMN